MTNLNIFKRLALEKILANALNLGYGCVEYGKIDSFDIDQFDEIKGYFIVNNDVYSIYKNNGQELSDWLGNVRTGQTR